MRRGHHHRYSRDCDLEVLKTFQQRNILIFQEMLTISKAMIASTEEASGLLRDDVSKRNLDDVRNLAEQLHNIAQHGESQMQDYLRKTKEDLDAWNSING